MNVISNIGNFVFFDLHAGNGRVSAAYSGIQKPQVVINFSEGSYRRAGVAGAHLLLHGNRRAYTFNIVEIGLLHPHQKLTGV